MAAVHPSRLRSASDPFVDPLARQRPPAPPPKSRMQTTSRNSSQHDITEAVRDTARTKISRSSLYVLFLPIALHLNPLLIPVPLVAGFPPPAHPEKEPSQRTPLTNLLAPRENQENLAARRALNMRILSIASTSQAWDPVSTSLNSSAYLIP